MNEQRKAMVIFNDGSIAVGYIESRNEKRIVLNKSKHGEIHMESIPTNKVKDVKFLKEMKGGGRWI